MEKFLLKATIIFACILSSSYISVAQYNVIKVDGLSLILPDLTVFRPSYERSFGKYFSLTLNFETGKYSTGSRGTVGGQGSEVYYLKGWGLMPEFKVYPFSQRKDSPLGFFFGTHVRYRNLREYYTGKDFSVSPSPPSYGSTPSKDITLTLKGALTEVGLNAGYKGKMGPFIFEPLIGFGTGFVSGFSSSERAKMDPFFANPINSAWNLIRVQFSLGFIFPRIGTYDVVPSDWSRRSSYAKVYI